MRMIAISSTEKLFSLFYNYSSFSLTCLFTESFLKRIGNRLKNSGQLDFGHRCKHRSGALAARLEHQGHSGGTNLRMSQFKKGNVLLRRAVDNYAPGKDSSILPYKVFSAWVLVMPRKFRTIFGSYLFSSRPTFSADTKAI